VGLDCHFRGLVLADCERDTEGMTGNNSLRVILYPWGRSTLEPFKVRHGHVIEINTNPDYRGMQVEMCNYP